MKKLLLTILLLTICLCVLCGCDNPLPSDEVNQPTVAPYKPQTTPSIKPIEYEVYVCGAVENEGYYVATSSDTVADVVNRAGILSVTIIPQDGNNFVKTDMTITVEYAEEETVYQTYNVNGAQILYNLPIPNVSAEVVQKLHDYVNLNGKITNKEILRNILTEQEYLQNYYKFFVSVDDYVNLSAGNIN